MTRRRTKEQFLVKLFERHPSFKEKYRFNKAVYINSSTKVEVYCKHRQIQLITPNYKHTEEQIIEMLRNLINRNNYG